MTVHRQYTNDPQLSTLTPHAAPGDYDSTQSPYTVTFQPGQLIRTVAVPTRDDGTVERTEDFHADLSLPEDSINLGVMVNEADEATVNIFDNDGRKALLMRVNM